MVKKTYCDFCGKEVESEYVVPKNPLITDFEIGTQHKDICYKCSGKIVEFTKTLKPEI